MDVDGGCGGFDGGEAVVVVERVEEFLMQNSPHAADGFAVEADGGGAVDCVVVGFRPAVFAGHDLDAVGAENVEFAQLAVESGGFDVGVAGDEQEADEGFEEFGAGGGGCGAFDEAEQRVLFDLVRAIVEAERHGGCGFGDHAHGAVDDRVLHEAFAGEGCVVARGPGGGGGVVEGEEGGGGRRPIGSGSRPYRQANRTLRRDSLVRRQRHLRNSS